MEAWAEALYTGKDTKKLVEIKAGAAGGMAMTQMSSVNDWSLKKKNGRLRGRIG